MSPDTVSAALFEYPPRDEWSTAFAAVVAARKAHAGPVTPVPAPGNTRVLSPLDPCEVCGATTVFVMVDDGSVHPREVYAVRINREKVPGQLGWLETQSRRHVCVRPGGDRDG